jgi:hypothetical protein
MRMIRHIAFTLSALLLCCAATAAQAQYIKILPIKEDEVVYQMIGEFVNSGASNTQYGYLSAVAGIDNAFSSTATKDETTALFTFVTTATTVQSVTHGPFRSVNRTGTTTIYLKSGPSSFNDPATFAQGLPIQESSFSQQVIVNISTNTFVTVHTNTVTHVKTFWLDGSGYRLGQFGKSFRTNYSGQGNTPGLLPTGWFAGTSTGSRN